MSLRWDYCSQGTITCFTMWPQNSAQLIPAASNIIKLISEPRVTFGWPRVLLGQSSRSPGLVSNLLFIYVFFYTEVLFRSALKISQIALPAKLTHMEKGSFIISVVVCLHGLLISLAYGVCTNQKEKKKQKKERWQWWGERAHADKLPPALILCTLVIKSRLAVVSLHCEDELETLLKLNFLTLPPAVERAFSLWPIFKDKTMLNSMHISSKIPP